jgi:hypothetical protein
MSMTTGVSELTMLQLALQSRFHGPLVIEPYPPHPIFTRPRAASPDSEAGPAPPASQPSFYKNTYAMVRVFHCPCASPRG